MGKGIVATPETIKDLTTAELRAKISSGEFQLPARGTPERQQYDEAVSKLPTTRPAAATPTPEPKPAEPQPAAPAPAGAPSDEWEGYGSKEAMLEAHRKLREGFTGLKSQLDKKNAEDGKLGRRLKDLEAERAALVANLEELKTKVAETAKQTTPQATELPDPPDPAGFDLGVADDGYVQAQKQWQAAVKAQMKILGTSVAADLKAQMEAELAKVRGLAEKATTYVEQQQSTAAQNEVEQAWQALWGNVHTFQESRGLKTSVPVEQINDQLLIVNSSTDPVAKQAAQQFIDSLPKTDLQAFDKVAKVVAAYAEFEQVNGKVVPKPKYRSLEGAIYDQGLESQYAVPKAAPAAPAVQQEKTVGATRAGDLSAHDNPPTATGKEATLKRYDELTKMLTSGKTAFMQNAGLRDEYVAVRRNLGLSDPPWLKTFQT